MTVSPASDVSRSRSAFLPDREGTVAGRERLTAHLGTALAVVAVVVAASMHIFAAFDGRGPVWTDDEIGILGNAKLIAGVGEPYTLRNLSYYPGWSVVIAPLWWLTQDPQTLYQGAVLLSAVCGAALMWPLARLGVAAGLPAQLAWGSAAVVSIAPSRVVMSSYALTENFLTLLLAVTALAAVRYAARDTPRAALLLGFLAAATFVTHGRAVGVLGMTVVWFLLGIARRRRSALLGLVMAVGTAVLGFRLHLWVTAELYGSAGDREANALSVYASIVPEALLRSLVGQGWYGAAAWLALPIIGFALVVRGAAREVRLREPGLAWWALGVVGAFVVISGPSVMRAIASGTSRVDVYVYGRYLEPVLTLLAYLGIGYLIRGISRRLAVGTLITASMLGALVLFWIVPPIPLGGWWAPINIPGLLGRSWPAHRDPSLPPWTILAVTAVLAALAYVVLRRRAVAVLPVVFVYFALSSFLADTRSVDDWNGQIGAKPGIVEIVDQLDPEGLAYDVRKADYVSQNKLQFWLTGRDVTVFDSRDGMPESDLVLSRRDWPRGENNGARRVGASRDDEALWVLPGELQRHLEATGSLEAENPYAPLADYQYSIEWAGEERAVQVHSDGDADWATVHVEVANHGGGVWPALGTLPGHVGSVRVIAWWPTEDGLAPVAAELPYTLLPGQTVTVEQRVPVPPSLVAGEPVGLGLIHEGIRFFDGDDGIDTAVPVVQE